MRHRYFSLIVVAIGILLTLGSLRVGWRLDDYYERWIISGSPIFSEVGRKPIDAFCFADGDPQRTERMIDVGLLPWWIDPHFKAAFWKPITVLTHMLDYRLWPDTPSLMHAQSIFWFALLVLSACLLYRRIMRPTLAAEFAGLLYAIDCSRAIPVAWLANRNAVLAGLFGILAIHAHFQSRRKQGRVWDILSPILLAISLLSAEAGIGATGYLVAFALTLDPGGWRRGLLRLWPHLLVVVAWRVAWSAQGYGVHGIEDLYTDPGAHPLRFAQDVLERAPLYMLGQWTGIPAEIHLAVSPRSVAAMWWAGVGASAIVLLVLAPLLRRSRVARFWGLGMLLATIPMCSAAPMNRHLIFIGLGGMGLLGQFFASSLHPRFWRLPLVWRAGRRVLIGLLVCVHLVLAPIGLAIMARYPFGPDELFTSFHALLSVPDGGRDLIFVNHPLPMDVLHLLTARAVDHEPLPRSAQILAPASTAVLIERKDESSLLVRPDSGFFSMPASRLGYSREHPPVPGQTFSLPSMRITIVEMTPDARPAAVLFQFNVPLEDASLQWVYWESGSFREFRPPRVGGAVRLPASGLPF
ncbi:MAG TPA: hypothetical protein VGY55_20795 [Pirellulales bacterium]|nr:hypothetical protein [Pirellulales bacterium]